MSRLGNPMLKLMLTMMGPHERAGAFGLRLRSWAMRHVRGMLTCAEFEEFIHDYQEDSLDPRERRRFDLHMELCPMCRVYVESYLRTIELGKRVCEADQEVLPEELPPELVAAILDARSAR